MAPKIWPCYPILKSHLETDSVKTAQRILRELIKKADESNQREKVLEAVSKTSLNLEDVPSLIQHPTLFSKDSMKGTEIQRNFLQAIENGVQQPHHVSPNKIGSSPSGAENITTRKRKLRSKLTDDIVSGNGKTVPKQSKKKPTARKPKMSVRRTHQQVLDAQNETPPLSSSVDEEKNQKSLENVSFEQELPNSVTPPIDGVMIENDSILLLGSSEKPVDKSVDNGATNSEISNNATMNKSADNETITSEMSNSAAPPNSLESSTDLASVIQEIFFFFINTFNTSIEDYKQYKKKH
ncbi:hypothetical protein QAD02_013985 [Eretmocerus hayati]|uniref:Uncharacterized protein n=1 Tax=Eretmocerus hayati TaxID=131215 RepID=A0ACC2P510_9HYME|nr:hypothetical protein QAD02_013985 [Eretmocerus hayati]